MGREYDPDFIIQAAQQFAHEHRFLSKCRFIFTGIVVLTAAWMLYVSRLDVVTPMYVYVPCAVLLITTGFDLYAVHVRLQAMNSVIIAVNEEYDDE